MVEVLTNCVSAALPLLHFHINFVVQREKNMESEMNHFSHKHPLFLLKTDDKHSQDVITCQGCRKLISGGSYYSCRECKSSYCLHKVCAELPSKRNHWLHPDHPLELHFTYISSNTCDGCREICDGLFYRCFMCAFDLDTTCAAADMKHLNHKHPLFLVKADDEHSENVIICESCKKQISEGPYYSCRKCDSSYCLHKLCAETICEMNHWMHPDNPNVITHSSHKHPLILNAAAADDDYVCNCDGCEVLIWERDPFYSCVECRYYLHKICAELPTKMEHPMHSQHTLTLISTPSHPPYYGRYHCNLCSGIGSKFAYSCSICEFNLHPLCVATPPPIFMKHFGHEHPLFLKPELNKTKDDDDLIVINCEGCKTLIVGPFYTCSKCKVYLHKVCAELPSEMNHPSHPQHPLTPISDLRYYKRCHLCREYVYTLGYHCSICLFNVDTKCASLTHMVVDKCHPHPLIPLPTPTSFLCDICRTEYKGLSYKCTICPFWVHQNCTLLQPTVIYSYHDHHLTLLPLVPSKNFYMRNLCDICHDKLLWFQCVYSCIDCLFFAHVGCAISETTESSSRDHNIDLPPVQQRSTNFISRFIQKLIDQDADKGDEKLTDQDAGIGNKIDHFDHDEHPLILIDEPKSEKICEACAVPISTPLYGCIECDYFIHKCCAQLPIQIYYLDDPEYRLSHLHPTDFFSCDCCSQWSNGFQYHCEDIRIDIKCASLVSHVYPQIDINCASLIRHVYHEAHRHPLTPTILPSTPCTACNLEVYDYLRCDTCSFKLCFKCAMAPPIIKHRFDKQHPFKLSYAPPKNHYNEYICEICEGKLNPKLWHYRCGPSDQFTHVHCMVNSCGDSNIKYGKSYKNEDVHKHELTLVPFTFNYNGCSKCRIALNKGFSVGLECISCNYRIHLLCFLGSKWWE